MNDPLQHLGDLVSEREPSEEEVALRIQRVRARLSDTTLGPPFVNAWFSKAIAGVLVASVLAAGVLYFRGQVNAPLRVYAETHSGELSGQTVDSGAGTRQLEFSDGTRLSLHPQTSVHIAGTTPRGASLHLEKGRAFASIVPNEEAKWEIQAGPYQVRVTGTEFDVSWDSEQAIFELAMHRGSVVLTGPGVDGERIVQGSEFVRFAMPKPKTSPARAELAEASGNERPLAEEENSAASPTFDGTPSDASRAAPLPKEAPPSTDRETAKELWDMVRQKREVGDGTGARDALLLLRNRHGARGQTAYLLGRVHADLLRSTPEAVHWFEMYLKESPGGSLSEQALGRLIELQSGTPKGRAAAERYLELYPEGSYVGLARSSLR